jgi:outer membrane protein assembly factor BamB
LGYDVQHSGNNPQEKGAPPVIDSWSSKVSLSSSLNPVVVENGKVFVTYRVYFNDASLVTALNISDGSPIWSYNFGAVESLGFPAVFDNTVYLQTNHGTSNDSHLWALNATTGETRWSSVFGSQWENFWSPIVVDSKVYVDGGYYGGIYAFNVSDGSQVFFNNTIGQYDSWSPAFFGGNVYTFIGGTFSALDKTTGNALWNVKVDPNVA